MGYRVEDDAIVELNYHHAYVSKNLNPLVITELSSESAWIESEGDYQYAELRASFSYSLGPWKGMSSQVAVAHVALEGFADGDATA